MAEGQKEGGGRDRRRGQKGRRGCIAKAKDHNKKKNQKKVKWMDRRIDRLIDLRTDETLSVRP